MQQIDFLIRYVNYLQQAKNKFDVHSPFLFDLITGVMEDKQIYPEYHTIESLKSKLLKIKEQIEVKDLGAGSTTGRQSLRAISSITRHSSKPKKYGRLLFRLSQFTKPLHILELGTAMGISSAYLAMGNKNSHVTTVEGCPNISRLANQNFKTIGLQNVTVLNGNFDDVLPVYLAGIPQLDLAFIDGNHREAHTINYFNQCLMKTTGASCLIFDDIHWSKGMENAWKYIVNHKSVTLSLDLFFVGIVFFRKELTKQHFIIRF